MENIFLDYYFSLLEVLFILFLVGAAGTAVYWEKGRRWQNRLTALEQEHADEVKTLQQRHADDQSASEQKHTDELKALDEKHADEVQTLQQRHTDDQRALKQKHTDELKALEEKHADELKTLQQRHTDDQRALKQKHTDELKAVEEKHADVLAKHDSKHFRALYNNLQRVVAHGFGDGLIFIKRESAQTLEGLGEEQNVLREKQNRIFATAHELNQRAYNTLYAFASDWDKLQEELLTVRQLVESTLIRTFPYAESNRVTLMPNLHDVDPTVLYRELTLLAVSNVIDNAIKYSFPGGVVGVDLSLEDSNEGAEQMIYIEVKDTGKGIKEEDQEKIFDLNVREDGLLKPGSGLGLYLARKAARYQGGDVILVHSSPNQGSLFRIILPYTAL